MRRLYREMFHGVVDLFFVWTGSDPWRWSDREPDNQKTIAETVLIDPTGQPIRLGDWRGHIIVLSFWRASSPQCRDNIAAIERLGAELGDLSDRVKFVLVSIRTEEYADDLEWLRQSRSAFSTHRWEDRPSNQVNMFFQWKFGWKVPATFLIRQDGHIANWTSGTTIDLRSNLQQIRNLVMSADAAA